MDAEAFDIATTEGDVHPREVRILFSQALETATMKGLVFEGEVKPIGPNESLERAQRGR